MLEDGSTDLRSSHPLRRNVEVRGGGVTEHNDTFVWHAAAQHLFVCLTIGSSAADTVTVVVHSLIDKE